jgi:hypothetical protein
MLLHESEALTCTSTGQEGMKVIPKHKIYKNKELYPLY